MRNQQRLIVTSLSAVLAAGATALFPLAASAQLVLEEVVVTARKREETLQETPIAVTALTGENLQELRYMVEGGMTTTDALITAAWLREAVQMQGLLIPEAMSARVAQLEGWTFGIR